MAKMVHPSQRKQDIRVQRLATHNSVGQDDRRGSSSSIDLPTFIISRCGLLSEPKETTVSILASTRRPTRPCRHGWHIGRAKRLSFPLSLQSVVVSATGNTEKTHEPQEHPQTQDAVSDRERLLRKSSGFLSKMKVSTPKKEVFSYFSLSSVPCHSQTHQRGQCNIKRIVLSFLSLYSDTSPLFHFLLLPPSAHMVTAASQDLSVTQVLLVRMPRT